MTKVKRNRVIGVFLSVLLIAALIAVGNRSRLFGNDRRRSPEPLSFSYRWPAGTRYTYLLHWGGRQHGTLPMGTSAGSSNLSLNGAIDLQAQLVLRSLEERPDGFVIGASIAEVSRHQLDVLNQALLPDAEAVRSTFDGQE